jgi:PAS domain S-box-containing protein
MFEFSPISIWDEDFSAVKEAFDLLKEQGITNFREYFSNNSEALSKAISLIKVTAINETSVEIFGIESKDEILNNLSYYFYDNISEVFAEEFIALAEGRTHFEGETVIVTKNGLQKHLLLSLVVMPGYEKTLSKVLVSFIDITKRKLAEIALLKSQQELKSFTAHLQNVREEEKIAVAREIHDDLGQILVALKIDMGMLRNKISKRSDIIISEDVLLEFDDIVNLINNTIKTTRRIMNGLRPEQLELLGFVETARLHVAEFQERHKLICNFETTINKLKVDPQHEVALFRILQEALTNITRHAKASEVKVKLTTKTNLLILEIIDNGVGIDTNYKGRDDSYGMIGMKERVYLLGAELFIKGEPGKGTIIRVEMPLLINI